MLILKGIKQKTPSSEVLCGDSELLERKQDLVACIDLRSLLDPHYAPMMLDLALGRSVDQELLFTATPRPNGQVHRTKADDRLIAQPPS